jgi:hypothetical protein
VTVANSGEEIPIEGWINCATKKLSLSQVKEVSEERERKNMEESEAA